MVEGGPSGRHTGFCMVMNVSNFDTQSWARRFFRRLLTVLVLMLATPGAAHSVDELVSMTVGAFGDDCCDDGCDDSEQGCEGTCGHCVCCAHPNVLLASPLVKPADRSVAELTFVASVDQAYASGFSVSLFRPPTA